MKDNSCYFLNERGDQEGVRLRHQPGRSRRSIPAVVGKPAWWIAEQAGVKVPEDTKILLAKLADVGPEYPLSREKLSPVLAYFVVKDAKEGFE